MAFEEQAIKMIKTPINHFKHFINRCFKPFSGELAKDGVKFKELQLEQEEMLKILRGKIDKRKDEYHLELSAEIRKRVRMMESDLEQTLIAGATLAKKYFEDRIFRRARVAKGVNESLGIVKEDDRSLRSSVREKRRNESEFWIAKGLPAGDWFGLTGYLLSEIFSPDFLCVLNDSDTRFLLEMRRSSDLSRYYDLLSDADRELEEKKISRDFHLPITTCKKNFDISPPSLDLGIFNPIDCSGATKLRMVKSRYRGEMMQIPLAIPHPISIATAIYNRDNIDPVPLELTSVMVVLSQLRNNRERASNRRIQQQARHQQISQHYNHNQVSPQVSLTGNPSSFCRSSSS
jgi:hypothetical protein